MIIDRLWEKQEGKYFCLSTKSATDKWQDHFFERKNIKTIQTFITENSDKNIYFCPHGFSRPRRIKANAVLPRLLWSDLDEADPRKIKIKPTLAIESSPGRYVGIWIVKETITEELNRKLNYLIGADKSGWDLTQVLRVPGTRNYKYHSIPRVKILWSDGPEYARRDIEKLLPKDVEEEEADEDAAGLFKKYAKKLTPWARRELLNGKPTEGKRSEVFWKLVQELIEAGIDEEDAFVLLKASPWNKFAGRYSEDRQIRRELDKALSSKFKNRAPSNKKFKPRKETEEDGEPGRLLFRSMDQVEEENIDWIWYPYLARGELTIVEGDPGLGKSYLMQMVGQRLCDGEKLPSIKKMAATRGKVLYFDLENSAGSVTKKRLINNGLKEEKNFVQCEEPFSVDDEDAMNEVLEYVERERPQLVVFDTLNTYIGKADAFKGHEAQQAFVHFRDIAKRFDCAVVVLRHLTKGGKGPALYRGQGSIAFAGLARVVISVGRHPQDADRRALAVAKINVAKVPPALTFHIEALPDTLKEEDRSKFVWGDFEDFTADDIVSSEKPEKNTERDDAKEFLETQLDEGEVEVSKLEKMAESRSIARRTLHRAAEALGIVKRVTGFGKQKRSYWSLADQQS